MLTILSLESGYLSFCTVKKGQFPPHAAHSYLQAAFIHLSSSHSRTVIPLYTPPPLPLMPGPSSTLACGWESRVFEYISSHLIDWGLEEDSSIFPCCVRNDPPNRGPSHFCNASRSPPDVTGQIGSRTALEPQVGGVGLNKEPAFGDCPQCLVLFRTEGPN